MEIAIKNLNDDHVFQTQKLLDDNNIFAEAFLVDACNPDFVGVLIEWGDWKHDHLRADYLVHEYLDGHCVGTRLTEEDGSDCYSAIHFYDFKKGVEL